MEHKRKTPTLRGVTEMICSRYPGTSNSTVYWIKGAGGSKRVNSPRKAYFNYHLSIFSGMTSVHKAAKIDPDEQDFKTYIRKLHTELHRSLMADDHFSFNHVTQKRWLAGFPDYKDMNFSNMGLYSFPRKFETTGMEVTGYWTVGDNWCPLMFGNMVFLINTIPGVGFCYSLTFEDFEDNRQLATQMLDRIKFLCENPEEATF